MVQVWRDLGPKSMKKPAPPDFYCQQNLSLSLSLSLSLHTMAFSHQHRHHHLEHLHIHRRKLPHHLSLLYNLSSSFTSNKHRPPFPPPKPLEPPAEPPRHSQASTTPSNPLLLSFFCFFISPRLHCSAK